MAKLRVVEPSVIFKHSWKCVFLCNTNWSGRSCHRRVNKTKHFVGHLETECSVLKPCFHECSFQELRSLPQVHIMRLLYVKPHTFNVKSKCECFLLLVHTWARNRQSILKHFWSWKTKDKRSGEERNCAEEEEKKKLVREMACRGAEGSAAEKARIRVCFVLSGRNKLGQMGSRGWKNSYLSVMASHTERKQSVHYSSRAASALHIPLLSLSGRQGRGALSKNFLIRLLSVLSFLGRWQECVITYTHTHQHRPSLPIPHYCDNCKLTSPIQHWRTTSLSKNIWTVYKASLVVAGR